MRYCFVCLLFLSGCFSAAAQRSGLDIKTNMAVGTRCGTGGSLTGEIVFLSGELISYERDADGDLLKLFMGSGRNNKGERVLTVDPGDGFKILIENKTFPAVQPATILMFGAIGGAIGTAIVGGASNSTSTLRTAKSRFYDPASGISFRLPYDPLYMDRERDIIICPNFRDMNSRSFKEHGAAVVAYDYGGNRLWNNNLSENNLRFRQAEILGDSLILVAADGLRGIRISDGKDWHFYANVVDDAELSKSVEMAAKAYGNGKVKWSKRPGKFEDLSSNFLLDQQNGLIYWASKSHLLCVDFHGQLHWSTVLPADWTGRSEIASIGENIFLVNFGKAESEGRTWLYGMPYIAYYNKADGRNIRTETLNQIINSLIWHGGENTFYLLGTKGMEKRNTLDGSPLAWLDFPTELDFHELRLVSPLSKYHDKDSGTFISLSSKYGNAEFLYNGDQVLFVLDAETLSMTAALAWEGVFTSTVFSDTGYEIVTGTHVSYILDKQGQVLVKLDTGGVPEFIDGYILFIEKERIIRVKTETLFGK